MAQPGLRRFWRIYRENYKQERARREARERERPWTTSRKGFWTTLTIAWGFNFVDVVVWDWNGPAWDAVRNFVGIAWLIFAIWYLAETLSSRKVRQAGDG